MRSLVVVLGLLASGCGADPVELAAVVKERDALLTETAALRTKVVELERIATKAQGERDAADVVVADARRIASEADARAEAAREAVRTAMAEADELRVQVAQYANAVWAAEVRAATTADSATSGAAENRPPTSPRGDTKRAAACARIADCIRMRERSVNWESDDRIWLLVTGGWREGDISLLDTMMRSVQDASQRGIETELVKSVRPLLEEVALAFVGEDSIEAARLLREWRVPKSLR